MKRQTALNNSAKIAARLRRLGGVIGTPESWGEAVRVRRAWVFGSTAKGAQNPNDLDVLIDAEIVGRRRFRNAKLDKDYLRRYGMEVGIRPLSVANRTLASGMKMVRIHTLDVDGNFGDIAETKVMIYPRYDLGKQ